MAKPTKMHPLVDEGVVVALIRRQADLRAAGVKVSLSALVQVAIVELLKRKDLPAVLQRAGAVQKRKSE